jgi:hypothetical protein
MLGTNRRSTCFFGAEVPALLVTDADLVGDTYPHRKRKPYHDDPCFSDRSSCHPRRVVRSSIAQRVVAPDRASSALMGFVPETTAKIRLR